MDTIKLFLDQYKLCDNHYKNYEGDIINEIIQILNGNIKQSYDKSIFLNYAGLYYKHYKKNLELAEKYYLMAIEKNSVSSMNNLGILYYDQGKYDLAERYLLMAVNEGNQTAMNNLGYVYKKLKSYDFAEKFYLMSIEKSNINAMNNLGIMYCHLEQYEIAETYFMMANEKNNPSAIINLEYLDYKSKKYDKTNKLAIKTGLCCCNLGNLYFKQNKYELAEKCFLMAIKKDNSTAMNILGSIYSQQKKYELAEKYFLMGIEKNDIVSMNHLGYMYYKQEKYELAEKYCLMAAEANYTDAINNLGHIYRIQKKYDIAKKYYLMAAERDCMYAFCGLGSIYQKEKKTQLAEKYYLMAIDKDRSLGMELLEDLYFGDVLKFYYVLKNIPNKNKLIENKINELKKNENIICYENSINFLSKMGECPICLETTNLIPRRCAHFYCYDCFVEINKYKCAVCRI